MVAQPTEAPETAMSGPILTGDRVRITLASVADAEALLSFHKRNHAHLKPWSPPSPTDFLTLGYWRRWTLAARSLFDQDRAVRLVIRARRAPTGPLIGQINFSNILRGSFQAATVGYHVDMSMQGRGLMTEAMRLAIAHSQGSLRLHRIMANYLPENGRSARLLQRLGFEIEGYAREYLFIDGAWRDHVLAALVRSAAEPPAPSDQPAGTRRVSVRASGMGQARRRMR